MTFHYNYCFIYIRLLLALLSALKGARLIRHNNTNNEKKRIYWTFLGQGQISLFWGHMTAFDTVTMNPGWMETLCNGRALCRLYIPAGKHLFLPISPTLHLFLSWTYYHHCVTHAGRVFAALTSSSTLTVFLQLWRRVVKLDVVGEL